MSSHFDSSKSLINHAKEDLAEFQSICAQAIGGNPYANVVDHDPQTGDKTYKIKFTGAIPSRARYVANNVLNNLRHSLDQSLVASFEKITGTRSGGNLYFPFATNPDDLEGRLRSLPAELSPILRSFQPYPSGAAYIGGNDFLCAVTKVVGPNKHQITLSPSLDMGPEFGINTLRVGKLVRPMGLPPIWDMSHNEMVLGTVTGDSEIQYDFQIFFHIAFGDAGPMFRQPVIPVLHEFAAIADRIVLSLEAETDRILGARRAL